MIQVIGDPRIAEFCSLVNKGIDAWTEAGRLLCDIVRDNPEAYINILSDNPHLSRDVLESFERIGRKEIHPYLLVDGSPGARRLAGLPYASQVKLYEGRITVVVKTKAGFEQRRKRVCELTSKEAGLVFDVDRMRTVQEQSKLLGNHSHSSNPHCRSTPTHESESNGATLDETPTQELLRVLTIANDALLEARTALAMIQRGSPHDALLTTAFRAIGELRYAANEGELISKSVIDSEKLLTRK